MPSTKDILEWLDDNNYEYKYNGGINDINGFSSLKNYRKNDMTWIKNEKSYRDCGYPTNVSFAIVEMGTDVNFENALYVKDSKKVFFSLLHHFWGSDRSKSSIGQGTYVSGEAIVDQTVTIGHNCTIDGKVIIGARTIIENNVVIQGNVRIGANCIIHSGAVIGCDGYGFFFADDGNIGKVEHFGGVNIADNVEIGACACIDRGTIDDTSIGFNSKIDNLVHIAHNVRIGENVCVVAGAVVCGSAELDNNSYVAPGGIVKNQAHVGENGFIGLGAVVTGDVDSNKVVVGVPAKVVREFRRGDK